MTDEHLSADSLADLQEGLLDADGEAAARRHLESCASCRDDLALLTGTPALLAAAADVGPVPELVAHRLERALADAAADTAAPATAAATTVTPLAAPRRSPRGMQLLQAAAVLVLVLGLGALGVSALRSVGGSSGDSAGSASAARDASGGGDSAATPLTASGRNWTQETLRSEAAELADGTLAPAVGRYAARDTNGSAAGKDQNAPEAAAPSASALAGSPAAALADPAKMAACVTNLTEGAGPLQPLAVDLARYRGAPAAVFVFPAPEEPDRLDVFVVAPDCPPGGLLYYASVPRS
jgi:hypothetical protein